MYDRVHQRTFLNRGYGPCYYKRPRTVAPIEKALYSMFSTPAGGPDVREAPACYDGEKRNRQGLQHPKNEAERSHAPARGIGNGISLFSYYKARPTRKRIEARV